MKKIIPLCLFISLLFTASLCAQPPGWSKQDKIDFISSCIGTAKAGMSEDSARHYCICMQEKIEKKYPSAAEAGKLTSKDLSTPEWKKEIQACLKNHWTDEDRSTFLTSCINTAKQGVGEEKAKGYCECMLYKVEKKYPNSADAAKLTGEDFAKPEWKKAIQDCLQ